jgi:peptidyl-prolyl cis-trans isomerase SurA
MKFGRLHLAVVLSFALLHGIGGVRAENTGVLVTVNDLPITSFDVDQRIALMNALGNSAANNGETRKKVLEALIDDVVKRAEARKYKAEPTLEMVDAQIAKMAKGTNTDVAGLTAQLRKKGVTITALRDLVAAQISFNRLLFSLYKVKVDIDPAEVDKQYGKLANDPRLQPVTIYSVLEINFPVDKSNDAMAQQLEYARAVEATEFKRRYRGCDSARSAARGIYNVKISKIVRADSRKLPKPLKAALDKVGPGQLLGPARADGGIQMIGFCGRQNIAPPKPSREQITNMLMNKKLETYETRYMREMRRNAFIEYKDASVSD